MFFAESAWESCPDASAQHFTWSGCYCGDMPVNWDRLPATTSAEVSATVKATRDALCNGVITYSPKVFIPVTQLCRDRCGYCTFAKAPARLSSPFLNQDEVLAIARTGQRMGCHEALFTLGECPEERYPLARRWLDEAGFNSTVDYLVHLCELVRTETGLLPHTNAGALCTADLAELREVSVSQGMMIETLEPGLECHRGSPDKTPERRLETLNSAGELGIPFTTGILVGIGESRDSRVGALEAIAASHQRFGHIQEVIVQPFLPKPFTAMRNESACSSDELLWSLTAARLILAPDVHLQSPPNLADDLSLLLDSGIDDLGGISPVTIDHVNPERAWPHLEQLEAAVNEAGFDLAPRLPIYPSFAREPQRWLAPAMRSAVLAAADASFMARDHAWSSGGDLEPPVVVSRGPQGASLQRSRASAQGSVMEVLDGILGGQEAGEDELVTLFSARGAALAHVIEVADDLRDATSGAAVTWVANRNINYTNICTFKCRFCAFSKGPQSLNLRGAPYLLSLEEISTRASEAVEAGATEVCLQGGIHPSFDGAYYLDVVKAVRDAAPSIHVHAFSALEVLEGARRLGEPLESYLQALYDAGLRTLPGTAAEILDDEVRDVLCPDKLTTEEWLEVHRLAHRVGLRSNVTIMFGSVETPRHWARHILRTRALQAHTGGFTEFVPLPFVHMASPIFLQGRARRGPTFREAILMHAVGRIAYHPLITNIQVSWVKMGIEGSRQALLAGANDLGGTLMDENISRAAGARHGQRLTEADFQDLLLPLGRVLVQRNTLYSPLLRPEPAGLTRT